MAAIRIYRRLQDQRDVDPNGLPDGGIPQYQTAVSSFVVDTIAAGGNSFSLGVSTDGNTLGDTGITGTRLVLAGIGRVTLSQSTDAAGGTITISGGTAGVGAFSGGVSDIGNTDGVTGITGTQVVFAGGNNVTLSQSVDGNGGTITIIGPTTVAQSVQTQNLFDLTLAGNTAGALAVVSSGTLTLAGGNSITLSQNGNAITISGASTSQSVQTQPIQTGISSIVASNATYTSGSVQFTGSNMVTVRSSANQRVVIDATQSVQTQNLFDMTISGNTAGVGALVSSGTLTLAGGSNITLSQNGNAISIIGNAAATETQVAISGLANSQTTYTSGTVSLSELGAITIRSTTGNQFQLSVNPQSVQPETQTFLGGLAGSNTTYTSGTVTITGVGGGITVSSNTGQRIDLSVAAQSVQPGIQNLVASNTTFSSGTVSISGFGAATVNTAANIIRISVPVQTAESQSIGMSNIGNTSGTTGIASGAQVRMLFAGGNNVTLSQSLNGASGTITISAANQTVQTQNVVDVTLSGNTAGAMALISSGTMTLAGGNNITVSQAGNAVTISGPNVGGAQTGISGIVASDVTYTSGTVQFTGSNMVTVKSSAGQRVVIDATQSVQPGVQNIVASDATFSSGTVSISGFGAVTVNTAANIIRISAPVQTAETAISGIANSQTTYTSGTVSLSELGAITIRSTTGNQFQLSVNPQTGTQFSAGISGGNTAGDTGTVAGRVVLAGGANITLSGSTNGASETISIVGGAGGAFSAGISGGNTSGDTGATGTRVVLAGGNNITLSGATDANGGSVTVSAPNASVISAVAPLSTTTNGSTISILAPAQLSVGFSTQGNTSGDTGFVTGRLALVGSNGITLSGSTNAGSQTITISGITQSAESQSIGMSNLGNTSGTTGIASGAQVRMLFAGAGEVTLSQSLNGASGTITISSPPQTVESQSFGMSNIGNTSGTTGIASGGQVRFLLAGGNNITLSQSLNGASGTITISAPNAVAQTNQTLGMYAVQNTTGQSSSTTMDARTISVAGDGAASVGYSAGSLRISVPTQTVESQSIGMSNVGNTSGTTGVASGGQIRFVLAGGNNVTLSQSLNGASGTLTISAFNQTVESQSIGMSNIGNTSGTTGVASGGQVRFVFAGGNNITLSQSLNGASGTITISAPNLGAGAMSAGVSNLGNSAGATGITGTQLVLVGSNNITLSQTTGANGGTVSIIGGGGGGFSAGVSTGGNTAGATGVSGTQMVLVGTNAISLSQTTGANGNTVSIDAPATSSLVGASGVSISTNGSTISVYHPARTQFYPFNDIPIVTGQQGQATLHIAPIHFPNIQHDRLMLGMQMSNATNSSNSFTISAWAGIYSRNVSSISLISSISMSTNFTGSGTVGSYSLYGGPKWLSIPWTNTITEDDYWFGIVIRTTTGGGAGHTVSQLCVSKFTNSAWSGLVGAGSNATDQYQLGLGVYTASTSGMPGSIAFTQINGSGSMALREPIFQLRSGTV